MMFRKSLWVVIFAACSIPAGAQIKPSGIRDTSFTIAGSYQKELKYHPSISIVDSTMPDGVTVFRNVTYRTTNKDRTLLLDVYKDKEKKTKAPAILMIHGGGWRSGDRTHNATLARQLADKGFVAITADYRLSTEALYPAAIHDLKAAVRWIKANAAKYDVDTSRVAVLGFSAGGELAAFIGATNGNKQFDGPKPENSKYTSDVHAIIDVDGTLAFIHPESGEGDDSRSISAATYWFGYSKAERPAIWEEAAPLTHVGKATPPTLFINSAVDRMHAGRTDFIRVLDEHGTYNTIKSFPDAPHTFMFFNPWFEPTLTAITDFLNHVFPPLKP
jgi:pectinesterase